MVLKHVLSIFEVAVPPKIRFRLLGAFVATDVATKQRISITSKKSILLLAYLAMHPDELVERASEESSICAPEIA